MHYRRCGFGLLDSWNWFIAFCATCSLAATTAAAQKVDGQSDSRALREAPPPILPLTGGDGCQPEWVPTFGAAPGIAYGTVTSFAVFDDGSGPALYVGGGFEAAGNVPAPYIVRWDGEEWSPVGEGFNQWVMDLIVFDDGSGSALYAAGSFTQSGETEVIGVAKWDGTSWTNLDTGLIGLGVSDLEVYDDGTGPALYACGRIFEASGKAIKSLARWDGSVWHEVGGGVSTFAWAMTVHDDGSGPMLYVGGNLYQAGNTAVNCIARWDGVEWRTVGEGFVGEVNSFAIYDQGNGPELFAGGRMTSLDQFTINNIARWDGSAWHDVGGGIHGNGFGEVDTIGVHDFGNGMELWADGNFDQAGDTFVSGYAQWNGATWTGDQNSGLREVNGFAIYDDGSGPTAFVAGQYLENGFQIGSGVLQYGNGEWVDVGGDPNAIRSSDVRVVEFDSGAGVELIVYGKVPRSDGSGFAWLSRWTGVDWDPIADDIDGRVLSFLVIEENGQSALVAGGTFESIDGQTVNHIAQWDGESWTGFGEGLGSHVNDIALFDSGSGSELYVAGPKTFGGPKGVMRWEGASWVAVQDGVEGEAHDLIVFDDGSGEAMYVGGWFSRAGSNTNARGVARWDGDAWTDLAGGTTSRVYALAVFDDGAGPALYAGGTFTSIGGVSAEHIAKWNGQVWEPVGDGCPAPVTSLEVFDDGTGPALYVGMSFGGNFDIDRDYFIRRWDGHRWSGVGAPRADFIQSLYATTMSPIPTLYVGGDFHYSPAGDSYLAVYRACEPVLQPAPLVDFTIAFGSLLDGGLDELIDSDDQRLRARSGIGFSALEPTVLDLRIGAISPNVNAASINATIEARINNPNGAAAVRLRNWSTNQFETVHTYTIGTTETAEEIEAVDATNHIRATDGRIELSHKTVVAATFSALGFDGAFDQIALEVVD